MGVERVLSLSGDARPLDTLDMFRSVVDREGARSVAWATAADGLLAERMGGLVPVGGASSAGVVREGV